MNKTERIYFNNGYSDIEFINGKDLTGGMRVKRVIFRPDGTSEEFNEIITEEVLIKYTKRVWALNGDWKEGDLINLPPYPGR